MMSWKYLTASVVMVAAALVAQSGAVLGAEKAGAKDIVETAVGAGSFKTLVAAVQAAGLVETLKGEGPFTVFAPTDAAFAKVPKEKLEALLKDKKALAAVLTYHVVAGKVMAADVVKLEAAKTVQGQPVNIVVKDGKVTLNGVNVVQTDIVCSNGVIHVIDGVLLPPEKKKLDGAGARQLLERAVAQGARTYNAGQHSACADIYQTAMRDLVAYPAVMPEEIVTSVRHTLHRAESTHCPTQRSWILRRGIDHAYASMTHVQ